MLVHFYLLRQKSPLLGGPFADSIQSSKIKNLQELRVQVKLKLIRIFFVFPKVVLAYCLPVAIIGFIKK
ncbi:hypothetical protein NUH30_06535 [Leptospira sp. 85282-16]|uniref:hypothetical protein n=1 Tax=Leptospira sp. 85282-16 TaxID=2971256 RepID=UPI0021C0506A|nr:hypothetical protein [Leptospira sp. 85282-16]MCT8333322.1 hypothetical protein [Leptospira sp. 85282-16]